VVDSEFPVAARRELAFLVDDYAFELVEATANVVRFASERVVVAATFYPNEWQVDLTAALSGDEDRYARLVLSGMVGRASPARVIELLAEKLRGNTPALTGDGSYYRQLGEEQRQKAEAWTAFYAGKGHKPTGKLP
jgi:hypothetical protein